MRPSHWWLILLALPALGQTAPGSRDPGRTVSVAVLQAGSEHSRKGNPGPDANFELLAGLAQDAAKDNPDLIVFPEYAISGWPYPSTDAINGLAEFVPGDGRWYRSYRALAISTGRAVLAWITEKDSGKLYSTAFLLNRTGELVGKYRKVHTNVGEQARWGWSQGDSLAPIEYDGVRYGISICADMWYPETILVEHLLGADIVIHQSISDDMEHIAPTRAFDSETPIAMAIFRGGSYAIDSRGKLMEKLPAATPGWKTFRFQPFRMRWDPAFGGWLPKKGYDFVRNPKAYEVLTDPARRPPLSEVFVNSDGVPHPAAGKLRTTEGAAGSPVKP